MIELANLGQAVRFKRGDKSLRTLGKELGISSSALSRIENGHIPDLRVFLILHKWLEPPKEMENLGVINFDLYAQYTEMHSQWMTMDINIGSYVEWLQKEVLHWRECAEARYIVGVMGYSSDDLIANLQTAYNSLAQLAREQAMKLEVYERKEG